MSVTVGCRPYLEAGVLGLNGSVSGWGGVGGGCLAVPWRMSFRGCWFISASAFAGWGSGALIFRRRVGSSRSVGGSYRCDWWVTLSVEGTWESGILWSHGG